jgi:hypothetical protein
MTTSLITLCSITTPFHYHSARVRHKMRVS